MNGEWLNAGRGSRAARRTDGPRGSTVVAPPAPCAVWEMALISLRCDVMLCVRVRLRLRALCRLSACVCAGSLTNSHRKFHSNQYNIRESISDPK